MHILHWPTLEKKFKIINVHLHDRPVEPPTFTSNNLATDYIDSGEVTMHQKYILLSTRNDAYLNFPMQSEFGIRLLL